MTPIPSRLPTPLLIGYLSDRSGRRKPWMVAGAALVAAGAWFLYNPPRDAGTGHLLAGYLVVTFGWTAARLRSRSPRGSASRRGANSGRTPCSA